MGLRQLQNRLKRFNIDLEVAAIMNNQEAALRELLREQWKHGQGKDGGRIGEYRSIKYKAAKSGFNPTAGGYVDLTLTGKLGKAIRFSVVGQSVWVRSDDSKYDKLSGKYPNAWGLNSIYVEQYQIVNLLPALKQAFKTKVLS